MSKRLFDPRPLVLIVFALMPLAAYADDPAPTDVPPAVDTPAPTSAPAPVNPAAGLGPAATAPSAGGSTADAGSLQPAAPQPLQATTGDSTGLTAPNSNTLQAPATGNDNLRVLAGEADGSPHQTDSDTAGHWGWLWWSLGFGIIVAAVAVILRRWPLPSAARRALAAVAHRVRRLAPRLRRKPRP
jgi:hypothetical protein